MKEIEIKNYRNLLIWQKSMDLVEELYKITESFPKTETYSLVSQIRRSGISIPSNIAEGSRRFSKKSFRNFLIIAYASGAELETQMEIAKRLKFININEYNKIESKVTVIQKMINSFISKMKV